jgi:membrane protease subunit HflC
LRIRLIFVLLTVIVLAGVLGSWFVVDASEFAVRTRLGRPVEEIRRPGLHWKLPLLDAVLRLDSRVLQFDSPTAEYLTQDKKNVVVSSFVLWRVGAPLAFLRAIATREGAQARLADLVSSELGTALGNTPFSHLISAVPGEARLREVIRSVADQVRQRARLDYGIELVDLRVSRLTYPDQNLASVFTRMRSERERIAKRFRSEGEEQATKIRAEADKERSRLLAEASRIAAETRGKGEAEAARIYADAIRSDPALYRFLRTLETYDKILDSRTTLILPSDSELLRLLTEGMPMRAGGVSAPRRRVGSR